MKILYICDAIPTFILNEIIELKKHGHQMFILGSDSGKFYKTVHEPFVIKNGLNKEFHKFFVLKNRRQKYGTFFVKVFQDFLVHPIYTMRACWYLIKKHPNLKCGVMDYLDIRNLFGSGISIIHSPFSLPRIIDKVHFLAKILNIPFTLCFRAHDLYRNNNMQEHNQRIAVIKQASKIITIARYNRDFICNNLAVDQDIEIIHSAIDPEIFQLQDGVRSHKLIVAVGRLEDQKGLIYLIKACHILHTRGVEYECTIIGEGPERELYQELISAHGIPNIHLVGCLSNQEIQKYLNQAAVFVLPGDIAPDGRRDILANALKEAMAMQVPVITSKMCGIEELVDDGINGLLVLPQNPEAFADAIQTFLKHPEQGKKMGIEGRNKIEHEFNVKSEAKKLEAIFKNAVNRN